MKVVILKSCAKNGGGLEKTASRIVDAFVNHGAKVSILTTEARPLYPFPKTTDIQALKVASWPSFLRIQQFDAKVRTWLKNNPVDIVFGLDRNRHQTHIRAGNGVHAAYLQSRIFSEGRLKYAACMINPLHQNILRIEKQAFENPELRMIFTNSHMVKREILDRFSLDPKKISVLHNGVEWEEMSDDFIRWPEEKEIECNRLRYDPDIFHLLFIGNGYLRKGLKQLLLGLSALNRKDVHLSVIGKDKNEHRYQAFAHKLGLASQVRFLGPQSNIRPYYQLSDALAIPSFYDPFANVTVEALAMGLFILSSKSNGGSEILSPETGEIIEDLLSVESVADSLQKVLQQKKTSSSALRRRASVQCLEYKSQMQKLVELSLA